MGWDVGATGLRIVLGVEVPDLVRANVRGDVDRFLADQGLSRGDIGWWVAHPGGPKVLEAMEVALEVEREALGVTWRSLDRIGNLSSASVLHVLADTLGERPPEPGSHGVMLAMGPGFCLELVLLEAAGLRQPCRSGSSRRSSSLSASSGWPSSWSRSATQPGPSPGVASSTAGGTTPSMVLLHTGLLVGAVAEVWLLDRPFIPRWAGACSSSSSRPRRCAGGASRSLGRQWNTRVIVVPGLSLVTRGPYRYLRHPNYVAVVVEGAALPLVHSAWLTAAAFTALNAVLLAVRIRVEDKALRGATSSTPGRGEVVDA